MPMSMAEVRRFAKRSIALRDPKSPPLELVRLETTRLEVLVPDETGELRKPWITLAIDARANTIVGFWTSFDPPSYASAIGAIESAVAPKPRKGRLPRFKPMPANDSAKGAA